MTKDKRMVNADVNAARNILRKSIPNDDEEIHYLRDRGLTIPKETSGLMILVMAFKKTLCLSDLKKSLLFFN